MSSSERLKRCEHWLLRNDGVQMKLRQGINAGGMECDTATMSAADLDALIRRLKTAISDGKARMP